MRWSAGTRIKVLHVTEALRMAGTERSLLMLLDNSNHAEFEHLVVLRGRGSLADELARRQAPTVMIPRLGRLDPLAPARFGRLVLAWKPHVVHLYGGRLEAVVATALGVPVVERKNVFRNSYYRPLVNTRSMDGLLNRFVDVSIAPAAAVRRYYVERGYDFETIKVIYNGVEPAPERSAGQVAQKRAELGLPIGGFIVCFAGRLAPEKGVDLLLRALVRLPVSVQCVVVGDGPRRTEYEQLAAELKLSGRVVFTGYSSDPRSIMAAADAVVLPSVTEALANVVLEGMAEGKPIVTTNVDGQPEAVLNGETGLLVPPGDSAALATAIGTLAARPADAQAMGARGKRRALQWFQPEQMARNTEQVYRELLHRRDHGKG